MVGPGDSCSGALLQGSPECSGMNFFLRLHKMEDLCGQRHIAGSPEASEVRWLVATMEGQCGLLT